MFCCMISDGAIDSPARNSSGSSAHSEGRCPSSSGSGTSATVKIDSENGSRRCSMPCQWREPYQSPPMALPPAIAANSTPRRA